MKRIKKIFHLLSYLFYPLALIAIFFVFKPYLHGIDYLIEHIDSLPGDLNNFLIFMGLAISLSTLQDTSKSSLVFQKKTWQNPKKGKRSIIVILTTTLFALTYGITGYFFSSDKVVAQLSLGAIVLGIGLIGYLKTAIEIFENYRKDSSDK